MSTSTFSVLVKTPSIALLACWYLRQPQAIHLDRGSGRSHDYAAKTGADWSRPLCAGSAIEDTMPWPPLSRLCLLPRCMDKKCLLACNHHCHGHRFWDISLFSSSVMMTDQHVAVYSSHVADPLGLRGRKLFSI